MQISYTLISSALAFAGLINASPIVQRQDANSTSALPTPTVGNSSSSSTASGAAPSATTAAATALNDTQILQFALTLEHLEAAFYNQSISKFGDEVFAASGLNSTVRDQLYSVGLDEASHVTFLETALGNQSVSPCTYDFSAVKDVPSFLATAQILEGVGTSAYLGAAALIADKAYLEAAGSILTVEARHATYINAALAKSNTSSDANVVPAPFDTPLNATSVYSLAAPFIVSCPDNSTLPLKAFPTANITLASTDPVNANSSSSGIDNSTTSSSSSSEARRRASSSSATGSASNTSSSSAASSTPTSATSRAITPGSLVKVTYDAAALSGASQDGTNVTSSNSTTYAAILTGVAAPLFIALDSADKTFMLPANITGGQSYVIVTSSNSSVTDDNTLAVGVAFIEVPLPKAPAASVTYSSAISSATNSSASATGGGTQSSSMADSTSTSSAANITPLMPTVTSTA